MQMDIFFFLPLGAHCRLLLEYRIELHEYVVQSGQMNVVQLFYLLKIRGLEIGKLRNACFSVPFYMGLCLRIATPRVKDYHICVKIGSVVSAACTKKSKGHTAKALTEIHAPSFGPREQRSGFHACLRHGDSCLYNQVGLEYCLPQALKLELMYINCRKSVFVGKAKILFIGCVSVCHVFSSFLDGRASPPPKWNKERKAFLAGTVNIGNGRKASFAAFGSLLSHQCMIAVWQRDWFCFGLGSRGLRSVSRKRMGNQQANHQRRE